MVRGTDLKILGLVGSDAGVYQCLATSPAGSIQAAAQLRVKSKGKTTTSRIYAIPNCNSGYYYDKTGKLCTNLQPPHLSRIPVSDKVNVYTQIM